MHFQNESLYDEYYFRHSCGAVYERSAQWLQFFGAVAENIVHKIGPRTVLDAGCAMGFLVEALRERGVEAFGLDISEYAIQRVREDLTPYCWVGSVLDPLPRRYDLVACIEVLEHLPLKESEQAIQNICNASDDILFSSTPRDYREVTHSNVQPPEYWAELFAIQGFVRDVDFDASFLLPWAVRFRKNLEPAHRVLRGYERKFWTLWQENQEVRGVALDLRNHLAEREAALADLQSSPGWHLLQALSPMRLRLFPFGSRRERLALKGIQMLHRMTAREAEHRTEGP